MSVFDTQMVNNVIRKDKTMNCISFLLKLWLLSDILEGHETVVQDNDYYAYDGYDDYDDYGDYDDFDCFDDFDF